MKIRKCNFQHYSSNYESKLWIDLVFGILSDFLEKCQIAMNTKHGKLFKKMGYHEGRPFYNAFHYDD